MKVFRCDVCGQHVFFDNTVCLRCRNTLAFVPEAGRVATLRAAGNDLWRLASDTDIGASYRLCSNYRNEMVCNWAVLSSDENEFCRSCRLTRLIPDLAIPGNRQAWYKLEAAKRR